MHTSWWQRSRNRAAFSATVGGVAVLLLAAGGTGSADPVHTTVDETFGYDCAVGASNVQIGLSVNTSLPTESRVAEAVAWGPVKLVMSIPANAVEILTPDAQAVAADVQLTVAVSDGSAARNSTWSEFDVAQVPTAPEEPVALTALNGKTPPLSPVNSGVLKVSASSLTVVLIPMTADGVAAGPGQSMSCSLGGDEQGDLARLTVSGGSADPAEEPSTSGDAGASDEQQRREDASDGEQAAAASDRNDAPPECDLMPPLGPNLQTGCTWVTGYSNVARLGGAVLIEPALMNVALNNWDYDELPWGYENNIGDIAIPDGKFPTIEGSFVGFGFVPVEAKMELVQVGDIHVDVKAYLSSPFVPYTVTTSGELDARIVEAQVNGETLSVGNQCHTTRPISIELSGGTPEYTNILLGGPLRGIVTIPPFEGCGVSEDLDPLFTGMVSGPGNYTKMRQGTLCDPQDPFSDQLCPPTVPNPER